MQLTLIDARDKFVESLPERLPGSGRAVDGERGDQRGALVIHVEIHIVQIHTEKIKTN